MPEAVDQDEKNPVEATQYAAVKKSAKSAVDEAKAWLNFTTAAEQIIMFSIMDRIAADPGTHISDTVKKRIEKERLDYFEENLKDSPGLLKIQALGPQIAEKIDILFAGRAYTPEDADKIRLPLRDIDILSEQLELNLGKLPRPLIAS